MKASLQQLLGMAHTSKQHGVYSVCSAHPLVIKATLLKAQYDKVPALIEATSNQVDQFGGYTGMTPQEFKQFVFTLADEIGLAHNQIILGGDHLGPNVWQHLPHQEAMTHAQVLVAAYVAAGFNKIHLDASMSCADDPIPLTDEIVAHRAAILCQAAEAARSPLHVAPVYIIGTEVPTPGGALESIEQLTITSPQAAKQTIECHKRVFAEYHLQSVWPRIIGLVVQPGVEFDHLSVVDYQSPAAQALSGLLDDYPHFVFEAHSTDYQSNAALADLVTDGFAILKVGPALTFALREAAFSLAAIENILVTHTHRSHLIETIDQVMQNQPRYWQSHYHGDEVTQKLLRHYSYSDRMRYYWSDAQVTNAFNKMLSNLQKHPIPFSLLSQYFPRQYQKCRMGTLSLDAQSIIIDHIQFVLSDYASACAIA